MTTSVQRFCGAGVHTEWRSSVSPYKQSAAYLWLITVWRSSGFLCASRLYRVIESLVNRNSREFADWLSAADDRWRPNREVWQIHLYVY